MSHELIQRTFDREYAQFGIALPEDFDRDSAPRGIGEHGWTINVRYLPEPGGDALEVFASHRMTNDTLKRFESDGSITPLGSPADFVIHSPDEDTTAAEEAFYARNRAFYQAV